MRHDHSPDAAGDGGAPGNRLRSQLEDLIGGYQDHLGMTGRPARSPRSQRRLIACGLVALYALERERRGRRHCVGKLKRRLSFRDCARAPAALEPARSASEPQSGGKSCTGDRR